MVGKEEDDYTKEFTDLDGVIIPDENGGQVKLITLLLLLMICYDATGVTVLGAIEATTLS